jgi:hypothetical protein
MQPFNEELLVNSIYHKFMQKNKRECEENGEEKEESMMRDVE